MFLFLRRRSAPRAHRFHDFQIDSGMSGRRRELQIKSLSRNNFFPLLTSPRFRRYIQNGSRRTKSMKNLWAKSIILFLKRWFSGKNWKSRRHLKTRDLLNWTKCLISECSVELKGFQLHETFICFKKSQRSKVKRWIHRSCPHMSLPFPPSAGTFRNFLSLGPGTCVAGSCLLMSANGRVRGEASSNEGAVSVHYCHCFFNDIQGVLWGSSFSTISMDKTKGDPGFSPGLALGSYYLVM